MKLVIINRKWNGGAGFNGRVMPKEEGVKTGSGEMATAVKHPLFQKKIIITNLDNLSKFWHQYYFITVIDTL